MKEKSRRQKLADFYGQGNLRYELEGKLDDDAIDLLVDIVARYCEPKRKNK